MDNILLGALDFGTLQQNHLCLGCRIGLRIGGKRSRFELFVALIDS